MKNKKINPKKITIEALKEIVKALGGVIEIH